MFIGVLATTVKFLLTAQTSLQWTLTLFYPIRQSIYVHSYFNFATMPTSLQRQQPLRLKITSQYHVIND